MAGLAKMGPAVTLRVHPQSLLQLTRARFAVRKYTFISGFHRDLSPQFALAARNCENREQTSSSKKALVAPGGAPPVFSRSCHGPSFFCEAAGSRTINNESIEFERMSCTYMRKLLSAVKAAVVIGCLVPSLLTLSSLPALAQALRQDGAGRGSLQLSALFSNSIFMSSLIAWAMAQSMKVVTKAAVEKVVDWRMLFASGGMPSSHSSMCCALTTSIALLFGLGGPLFPICLAFTLIVMYDATSVRYHAGVQAKVLNVVVAEMLQGHPVSEQKLKELLGHTPLQVAGGATLGIVVACLYHSRLGLI